MIVIIILMEAFDVLKNIFAPALLCGLSALFLLVVRMWQFDASAHRCCDIRRPNGTQSIDQAQTVAITASLQTTRKCMEWRGAFRWRHIDQPNHDVGYIQYPSVGACCADGTVTATSITDSTKSATLQIKVNPLPARNNNIDSAADCGTAYNAALTASGGTSRIRGVSTRQRYPRDEF